MIYLFVLSLLVMVGIIFLLIKKNIHLHEELVRLQFEKFMTNMDSDLEREHVPVKEETKGFLQ